MTELKNITPEELHQSLENPNSLIRSSEKAEHSADVSRIDLRGSNLSFTDLRDADLRGASLENAILRISDSISVNVNGDICLKLTRVAFKKNF